MLKWRPSRSLAAARGKPWPCYIHRGPWRGRITWPACRGRPLSVRRRKKEESGSRTPSAAVAVARSPPGACPGDGLCLRSCRAGILFLSSLLCARASSFHRLKATGIFPHSSLGPSAHAGVSLPSGALSRASPQEKGSRSLDIHGRFAGTGFGVWRSLGEGISLALCTLDVVNIDFRFPYLI